MIIKQQNKTTKLKTKQNKKQKNKKKNKNKNKNKNKKQKTPTRSILYIPAHATNRACFCYR